MYYSVLLYGAGSLLVLQRAGTRHFGADEHDDAREIEENEEADAGGNRSEDRVVARNPRRIEREADAQRRPQRSRYQGSRPDLPGRQPAVGDDPIHDEECGEDGEHGQHQPEGAQQQVARSGARHRLGETSHDVGDDAEYDRAETQGSSGHQQQQTDEAVLPERPAWRGVLEDLADPAAQRAEGPKRSPRHQDQA